MNSRPLNNASKPYRTFEQRKQDFGFPETDPNYFKSDREKYKVAFYCFLFSLFGSLIHFKILEMAWEKEKRNVAKNAMMIKAKTEKDEAFRKSFRSDQEFLEYALNHAKEREKKYQKELEKYTLWSWKKYVECFNERLW